MIGGHFLDSSAIGKNYHPEVGTPFVRALFARSDTKLFISRLALVEVSSAFVGKGRSGELTPPDVDSLRAMFRSDIRKKVLRAVALKAGHFRDAERLINRYGLNARLRTLDAVQLAVALDLQKQGLVHAFVCADKALCLVAELAGFVVLNPETDSESYIRIPPFTSST